MSLDDFFSPFNYVFQPDQVDYAAKQLTYNHPFALIDLELSKEDEKYLNIFDVDTDNLMVSGDALYVPGLESSFIYEQNSTHNGLKDYIRLLSSQNNQETVIHISNLVLKLAERVASGIHTPCMSIDIEIMLKINQKEEYWHRDVGTTLQCELLPQYYGYEYKFLATLKGPSTLYYVTTPEINLNLAKSAQQESSIAEFYDTYKTQLFNSSTPYKVVSAPAGFGTVHLIHTDIGAIHSAPPLDNEKRLLIIFSVEQDQSCL